MAFGPQSVLCRSADQPLNPKPSSADWWIGRCAVSEPTLRNERYSVGGGDGDDDGGGDGDNETDEGYGEDEDEDDRPD